MTDWDVVVVGARCAGASLATHLAERGARVLVLDAAPLPSDQIYSTHFVQPPGMDELEALDVASTVRAASVAVRVHGVMVGAHVARIDLGDRVGHCVRRHVLDTALQERATRAGATIRDGCGSSGGTRGCRDLA